MSFTFHLGLRALLRPNAPCRNCDAVEDLGSAIQNQVASATFRAREPMPAGTELVTGEMPDRNFVYIWEGLDVGGVDPAPPDGLLARGIALGEGSAPSAFELPGLSPDILVPNLDWLDDSPRMALLASCVELSDGEFFVGRPVQIGSLDAMIAVLEHDRAERRREDQAIIDDLLEQMRIARAFDLFLTFCF